MAVAREDTVTIAEVEALLVTGEVADVVAVQLVVEEMVVLWPHLCMKEMYGVHCTLFGSVNTFISRYESVR